MVTPAPTNPWAVAGVAVTATFAGALAASPVPVGDVPVGDRSVGVQSVGVRPSSWFWPFTVLLFAAVLYEFDKLSEFIYFQF